jgi:methylenetetrahydrofolate dehydrogenase (NADP+) / methenyltetrahydrofolate cyclohydrolase / formyltetrahydrofolate synthetase
MTVAMLLQNTIESAKRSLQESIERKLSLLSLKPLSPVPSDIDIASAQTPKPIKVLAEELGLAPNEVCFFFFEKISGKKLNFSC